MTIKLFGELTALFPQNSCVHGKVNKKYKLLIIWRNDPLLYTIFIAFVLSAVNQKLRILPYLQTTNIEFVGILMVTGNVFPHICPHYCLSYFRKVIYLLLLLLLLTRLELLLSQ